MAGEGVDVAAEVAEVDPGAAVGQGENGKKMIDAGLVELEVGEIGAALSGPREGAEEFAFVVENQVGDGAGRGGDEVEKGADALEFDAGDLEAEAGMVGLVDIVDGDVEVGGAAEAGDIGGQAETAFGEVGGVEIELIDGDPGTDGEVGEDEVAVREGGAALEMLEGRGARGLEASDAEGAGAVGEEKESEAGEGKVAVGGAGDEAEVGNLDPLGKEEGEL